MRSGKQKHVLVAGGAGFVGSHLCELLLSRGAYVTCLDSLLTGRVENVAHLQKSGDFQLIKADVIESAPLCLRPDEIYNLACAASPPHYQADPVHTLMTSVLGTRNLLALAADCGARFLLASTSEVYGDPVVHPQPESYFGNVNPTGPRACYDEGKRAAETLAFDYARAGRVDVRVARIFNTYGPRMRADDGRVVSNIITQALRGDDVTIYGDGRQTRSFCYVSDMVDGLTRLMGREPAPDGPVNLGNPAELTVEDLASCLIEMTGSRSRLVRCPLPIDDPKRRQPDISRARTLLGWFPSTDLARGLLETIAWFSHERRPGVVPVSDLATSAVTRRGRAANGQHVPPHLPKRARGLKSRAKLAPTTA